MSKKNKPNKKQDQKAIFPSKQMEKVLIENEEKYRSLFENAPDGISLLDSKGIIIDCNSKDCELLGYSCEEIIGKHITHFFRDKYKELFRKKFPILQKEGKVEVELELKRKDGSFIPIERTATAFYDEEDNFSGVIAHTRDVTERKKIEEALRESEYEKTLVMDNISELLVFRNKNMKTIWASKSVSKFLNITPEENIGRICYKARYNRNTPCPDCKVVQVFKTGIPHQREDTSPDGRYWFVKCSPVRNESGEIIGTVEISVDISKRKKAEQIQSVLYQISKAVNTTENLDELFQIIHHQLGNIIDTTNFYIANYNEENGEINSPYFIDEKFEVKSPQYLRKNGVTNYIIKNAKPLFLTEELRKKLIKSGKIAKYDWKSKTLLGIPLKIEKKVVGCIVVRSYKEESGFSEKDLSILEFVSDQIAVAITRKKAEEKTEHLNAILRAIRNVNQLIIQEKDRHLLTKKACRNFIETRGFRGAWIVLFDDQGKVIDFAEDGLDLELPKLDENLLRNFTPSCFAKALKSDDVVLLRNVDTECKDCPRFEEYKDKGWSVMSKSLKYESKNYGIINVSLETRYIEDKEEHSLFDEVAGDIAYALYNLDVEEQGQKAKEALQESEQLNRTVIENSPIGISVRNKNGTLLLSNRTWQKLWGLSENEISDYHKPRKKLVFNDKDSYLNDHLDMINNVYKTGGEYFIPELKLSHPKKNKADWISQYFYAIKDDKENVQRVVILTEDITERKKATEQIKKDLHEKGILLNEIHHRVKNNLQVISSLLKLQEYYIEDKKILEIFRKSENRIRSMALIHQKLYETQDFVHIDFKNYIKGLSRMLFGSYNINPSKIRLLLEIQNITFDISRAIPIALILNELISNSLKYAFPENEKGEIKIILKSIAENKCLLIYQDNGVGIPEKIDMKTTKTLGMQLINMLTIQINGEITLQKKEGTCYQIIFKISSTG